jgi:hypothetical protein
MPWSTKKKFLNFILIMALQSMLFSNEKKTLVCILSETRAHELTYENFEKNVLKQNNADLAVCIGVKSNYNYNNPFYKNAKYRFCYTEPDDFALAFDYANQIILSENPSVTNPFQWRKFLKVKDQFLGGIKDRYDQHPGSAGILIFFRWFLLHNLQKEGLIDKYDFFIITRSDFIYKLPHPSTKLLFDDFIYIPDGENYGGVTDRHVILPKKYVVDYLNILEKMILNGNDYYNKMIHHSNWNLEQLIKFQLEQNNLFDKVVYFPYVMYSVRPKNGSTRWAKGEYNPILGYFIKYKSEYESALFHKKLFKRSRVTIDEFYLRHFKSAK